jgi:acetyl esterase/lipase
VNALLGKAKGEFMTNPFVSPALLPTTWREDFRLDELPDILVHAGGADLIVPDMYQLKERFLAYLEQTPEPKKSPQFNFTVYEGLPHVFQLVPLKERKDSFKRIAEFINRRVVTNE